MSREIKHRLISIENKIVGYEKWYEGSFDKETQTYKAHPCWLYSVDGEYWNPTFISHRYKDRFTGLLDKNKKEIYEGDIVLVLDRDWPSGDYTHQTPEEYMRSIASKCGVIFKDGKFILSHINGRGYFHEDISMWSGRDIYETTGNLRINIFLR